MTIPNWDFFGSTIVTQSFIRLTPDQQSKQGGIFNRIVIIFEWSNCSFCLLHLTAFALFNICSLSNSQLRSKIGKSLLSLRSMEIAKIYLAMEWRSGTWRIRWDPVVYSDMRTSSAVSAFSLIRMRIRTVHTIMVIHILVLWWIMVQR